MAESDGPPLGKFLASSEKATRDKAIKHLVQFLSQPSGRVLSDDLELAKLWKGIFYCFWMSDKPLVQQALATELAEILLKIPDPSSSLLFLRGFWHTIVREWHGIDRLRMDKYYMLVRRFVNATFILLIRNDWSSTLCEEHNTILRSAGGPLCPSDPRMPQGLSYHLTEIWLPELDKASADSTTAVPLKLILDPFLSLAARTPNKVTYQQVQTNLIDPLLSALSPPPESDEPPKPKRPKTNHTDDAFPHLLANSCLSPSDEPLDKSQLRKGVLEYVFEVASQEDTKDSNRRKLYAICKANVDEGDDS